MSSPINLTALNEEANKIFSKHLEQIPRGDDCVLYLTAPPNLLYFVSFLLEGAIKKYNIIVKNIRNIVPENKNFKSVVIVSSGDSDVMNGVCQRLSKCPNVYKSILFLPGFNENAKIAMRNFNLYPVYSRVSQKMLQNNVYVGDLGSDFLAIEDDYFLLPNKDTFKRIFIDHNITELYSSARALTKIQYAFGRIPEVISIGSNSERVSSLMHGMLDHSEVEEKNGSKIHACIIIDRYADMYTPLSLMQTTEQMLNERIGIEYGCVKVNDVGKVFCDKDPIFKEYRGMNLESGMQFIEEKRKEFAEVSPQLKELNEKLKKCTSTKEGIEIKIEMLKLMPRFHQTVPDHCELLTRLGNTFDSIPFFYETCGKEVSMLAADNDPLLFIEHVIAIFNDWRIALRLLALRTICEFKTKESLLRNIHKELLAEFSVDALEGIFNLEQLNLLTTEKSPFNFIKAKRAFNLYEFKESDPIRSTLNGYVPCILQIVQKVAKLIGNKSNDSSEAVQEKIKDSLSCLNASVDGRNPVLDKDEKCRILVFFVGGVTLTEVGLLKKLTDVDVIIGGTESVHGNGIIEQICPFLSE